MKKDLKKSRKKKWWRGQRLKSKFKELDFYGEQIALTYKGQSTYKTLPGAITTLMVLMAMTAFTIYRLMILTTKDDPQVSKQSFMRDLDAEPALIPA